MDFVLRICSTLDILLLFVKSVNEGSLCFLRMCWFKWQKWYMFVFIGLEVFVLLKINKIGFSRQVMMNINIFG